MPAGVCPFWSDSLPFCALWLQNNRKQKAIPQRLKMTKKQTIEQQQQETVDFMGEELEAATDCGPEEKPAKKVRGAGAKQEEAVELMEAEIEAATDCGEK
jgi:hypothetical protein